jgi:transcription initiation factor TFIIIB Brf1 subunit/transcription initiation factor TFIIB
MDLAANHGNCPECSGEIVDAGEELVCSSCGVALPKEILESSRGGPIQAIDFTGQGLGGYLGPPEPRPQDRGAKGLSGTKSSYRYMKLVSDYAGREDSTVYGCAKMIERICGNLGLPRYVMADSVVVAKRVLGGHMRNRASSAAISAYAIANACRSAGTVQVGVREILEAHGGLGKKVTMSDLIQLSIEVPLRTPPRRPQDCLSRILARLGTNPRVLASLRNAGAAQVAYFTRVRSLAVESLNQADEVSKSGHNPWALAATGLYVAELRLSNLEGRRPRLSQRDVAKAAGVAEYTVRDQYRQIFRMISNDSRFAGDGGRK